MKQKTFITVFVGAHILFIFLQIHKHSQIVKNSYTKQKFEQEKTLLIKKKQALTHQLYAYKNKSAIKDFATKKLGMQPLRLSQIKTLTSAG
ncbi:hypothetical protein KC460_02610 [Candidatus Dependentiae bacterium]|nr:hypothetical protein [Candidatus Dependentiae bacterium]